MSTESTYSDVEVAHHYDVLNPWGASEALYFGFVMDAESLVDIGYEMAQRSPPTRDRRPWGSSPITSP